VTQDEFVNKYGPCMLYFVCEAWALRKEEPSALGFCMDRHLVEAKKLLRKMYDDLKPPASPTANGQPKTEAAKVSNAPWSATKEKT